MTSQLPMSHSAHVSVTGADKHTNEVRLSHHRFRRTHYPHFAANANCETKCCGTFSVEVFGACRLLRLEPGTNHGGPTSSRAATALPSVDVSLSVLGLVVWHPDLGICQIISRP